MSMARIISSSDNGHPRSTHLLNNRMEGNDQDSMQLLNTFRSIHRRERGTHFKQRHHNQNTTSKNQKDRFFPNKMTGNINHTSRNIITETFYIFKYKLWLKINSLKPKIKKNRDLHCQMLLHNLQNHGTRQIIFI